MSSAGLETKATGRDHGQVLKLPDGSFDHIVVVLIGKVCYNWLWSGLEHQLPSHDRSHSVLGAHLGLILYSHGRIQDRSVVMDSSRLVALV